MGMKNLILLALVDPAVLPALRIAGTAFLIVNLIGGAYIFLNRHRFFDRDPNVDNDIDGGSPYENRGRVDPLALCDAVILILLISFWLA